MNINTKKYTMQMFDKRLDMLYSLKSIDEKIKANKDRIKSTKLNLRLANRESDLLTLRYTMHSKALLDFDMTLSTIRRLIDVKSRYSQDQQSKEYLNDLTVVLFDGLLRQISPNMILQTCEDYLQFFESFLAEYNKLNEANK